jgi:hypothetical protein
MQLVEGGTRFVHTQEREIENGKAKTRNIKWKLRFWTHQRYTKKIEYGFEAIEMTWENGYEQANGETRTSSAVFEIEELLSKGGNVSWVKVDAVMMNRFKKEIAFCRVKEVRSVLNSLL